MPENIYGELGSRSEGQSGDIGVESPVGADSDESVQKESSTPYKTQMMRSNIVMVVLFVGAAAAVYGLSLRDGPEEASAELKTIESRVDTAILRMTNVDSTNMKASSSGQVTSLILKTFHDQIAERQIPYLDLKKNPFVLVPVKRVIAAVVKKPPNPKRVEKTQQEISLEEATAALKTLHLQSVMMGHNGGTAIISNNLLTIGQTIEGFKITSISPKLVVMVRDGREFTLEMP